VGVRLCRRVPGPRPSSSSVTQSNIDRADGCPMVLRKVDSQAPTDTASYATRTEFSEYRSENLDPTRTDLVTGGVLLRHDETSDSTKKKSLNGPCDVARTGLQPAT
jgi:hypothetical protein